MLIVPTGEFLGIISDVLPLSPDGKDNPYAGVLLEWDGAALHAHATDATAAGISTYHPDDTTDFDDDAMLPVVHWGDSGGDAEPRWRVFVSLADAKEIVKTFKLAFKFRAVPLNVKVNVSRSRLIIERTRDTGKTEHVMTVQPTGADAKFPDIRDRIDQAWPEQASVSTLAVWGHRLAAFEHASRRGPVQLYPTGSYGDGPVIVQIGDRFAGLVTPQRSPDRPVATAAELRETDADGQS